MADAAAAGTPVYADQERALRVARPLTASRSTPLDEVPAGYHEESYRRNQQVLKRMKELGRHPQRDYVKTLEEMMQEEKGA